MGIKNCEFSEILLEQIRTNKISDEVKVHLQQCRECSESYFIRSWMTEYSGTEIPEIGKPTFNEMWTNAFRGKKGIDNELIERAMLPLKIGRVISLMISLSAILIFIIFKSNEIKSVGNKFFKLNFLDSSFIKPLVSMFRSSYFISIPITIIFISFIVYFLFTILKHSGSRSFGRI